MPNHRQDMVDAGDGRFADTDSRHIGRFDEFDVHEAIAVTIEGSVEVRRRHPAGRATANDQNFA